LADRLERSQQERTRPEGIFVSQARIIAEQMDEIIELYKRVDAAETALLLAGVQDELAARWPTAPIRSEWDHPVDR
jgi:hypothetical protein